MGGSGALRSVQEGADTAVWLATLPDDGPTDGFYYDRQRSPVVTTDVSTPDASRTSKARDKQPIPRLGT
jgi:hypothetical protein